MYQQCYSRTIAVENIISSHNLTIRRGGVYAPNGNPQHGPKFEFKLKWLARLHHHAAQLLASGAPVVLAGDFNIIPTELDVYAPERWRDDALFHPLVREAYAALLSQGWIDTLRDLHPGERIYTFWKSLRNAYQRDAGPSYRSHPTERRSACAIPEWSVEREHRGRPKSSDHAAVWLDLRARCSKATLGASRRFSGWTSSAP